MANKSKHDKQPEGSDSTFDAPIGWDGDPAWTKLAVEHPFLMEQFLGWRPLLGKVNKSVRFAPLNEFICAIDDCLKFTGINNSKNISKIRLAIIHQLFRWPQGFHYEVGNRKRNDKKSYSQFLKDRTKNLEITRMTLLGFFGRHDILPKEIRRHLLACLKEEIGLSKRIEAGWSAHFKKGQPITGKALMTAELFKILSKSGHSATTIDNAIEDLLFRCFNVAKSGKNSGDGVRATRNRKSKSRE